MERKLLLVGVLLLFEGLAVDFCPLHYKCVFFVYSGQWLLRDHVPSFMVSVTKMPVLPLLTILWICGGKTKLWRQRLNVCRFFSRSLARGCPFCRFTGSSRLFNHDDTVSQGWTEPALLKSVCNTLLLASTGRGLSPNNTVVRDTIVFSHSMGNLIVANAIKNGYCSLDSSVSWYGVGAPIQGSMAAAKCESICKYFQGASAVTRAVCFLLFHSACLFPRLLCLFFRFRFSQVIDKIVTCNATSGCADGFYSCLPSNPEFIGIPVIFKQYMKVCLSTPFSSSLSLSLLSKIDPFEFDCFYVLLRDFCAATQRGVRPPLRLPFSKLCLALFKCVCFFSPVFFSFPLSSCLPLLFVCLLRVCVVFACVQYGEENDGVVPMSSCLAAHGSAVFKTDPASAFYVAKANHFDITFVRFLLSPFRLVHSSFVFFFFFFHSHLLSLPFRFFSSFIHLLFSLCGVHFISSLRCRNGDGGAESRPCSWFKHRL